MRRTPCHLIRVHQPRNSLRHYNVQTSIASGKEAFSREFGEVKATLGRRHRPLSSRPFNRPIVASSAGKAPGSCGTPSNTCQVGRIILVRRLWQLRDSIYRVLGQFEFIDGLEWTPRLDIRCFLRLFATSSRSSIESIKGIQRSWTATVSLAVHLPHGYRRNAATPSRSSSGNSLAMSTRSSPGRRSMCVFALADLPHRSCGMDT